MSGSAKCEVHPALSRYRSGALSRDDGVCVLRGLVHGRALVVTVAAPGHQEQHVELTLLPDEEREIDVALVAAGVLRVTTPGIVSDPFQGPLFYVRAVSADAAAARPDRVEVVVDGSVRIDGLGAGPWEIRIERWSGRPTDARVPLGERVPVEVIPGETADVTLQSR